MPTVVWSFEGDTKDLEAALAQVQGSVNDTGKGLQETGKEGQKGFKLTEEGAKKAAKVVGGVLLAGLAAATAASVGLAASVVSVAKDLDNLAKQAKRAGTTAAELDKIRGVFDLAGVSVGQTDQMVKKFRVNLGKAATGTAAQADALALLGTKAEDFVGVPLDRKLAMVAKGMKGIEDPAVRATVATDLFGRSGLDILPLLEDGEEAWRASAAAIDQAGTATDAQAKQSEDLVDALALMDRTIGTLVRDSLVPMIPALIEVAQTVADTIQSFDVDRIIRWSNAIADVTSGAMLAWRALRGLDQEQRQAALASGEATEAIEKQGEAVEDARRALERWQTVHLGTENPVTLAAQPEMIAKTSAELERQLKIFRRLRGELSVDIPGLLPSTATAPTTPSGGGRGRTGGGGPPGVAAPTPADAAAVDAYAESWDALRGSVEALEGATGAILDKQLSASDRLIQRREEEDAQLVNLVNDAVAHAGMGEEQKSELIAKGTEARLALEQGLYADLEALRQKDLASEAAAQEEKLTAFEEFQDVWSKGLGEMVNAAGALALDIVGAFQDMNDTVMNDRIAAYQETSSRIEDINQQLLGTIDSAEKTQLEAEKARLLERAAAQKEAALDAWRTQKALALTAASINTALAVINAFATAPNAILGAVLAVVAGAAGAVAIASIAAEQPPSFHAGGILRASDVRGATMDSVMVRAKPGEGVLSTSGVAAAGGPDGVNALNAGRGSGGTTVNVIRFGTRTTEAISHQQLQSRTGNMQGALRAVRPKVGRSIPGRR